MTLANTGESRPPHTWGANVLHQTGHHVLYNAGLNQDHLHDSSASDGVSVKLWHERQRVVRVLSLILHLFSKNVIANKKCKVVLNISTSIQAFSEQMRREMQFCCCNYETRTGSAEQCSVSPAQSPHCSNTHYLGLHRDHLSSLHWTTALKAFISQSCSSLSRKGAKRTIQSEAPHGAPHLQVSLKI